MRLDDRGVSVSTETPEDVAARQAAALERRREERAQAQAQARAKVARPVAWDVTVRLAGGTRRIVTRYGTEERARLLALRSPGAIGVEGCRPVCVGEFRERFLAIATEGGGA